MQNDVAEDQADITKRAEDESRLESQRDAAGIVDFQDLTKSRKKKRENKIEKYLKSRLTRKLYRKLPRSVRRARQKARNLQRIPGKAKAKVVNKLTSMLPSKSKQAAGALSKIRGAGNIGRIAGPARYVFAGLEYSERKQSGQSEVQALSGVGGGLAGAAAGGIAGAKAGAVLGGAIGALFGGVGAAPGAAIGGILGGLIGSIGGGMAGSGIADTVTGAHETGTRLTKPGTAILHGTEAVVKKDAPVDMSAMSTLGGIMLASTTQFINSAGAVAAPIAPVFKGMAGQLAQQYDIPPTIAQTNIGGSLPQLDKELKKIKEKRKQTPEEELKGIEKDLLETQDEKSFVEKLLKIIDPEGKFQELLKKINSGGNGTGDFNIELIGEGAFDTGLRTGPSETIGGSAAYHQDLSFASGVSIEDQRKLILQLAVAYDKVGRELVLSNQGVHGRVFPVKGSKEEQIKWIEDARAAHRARGGGTGRDAIDFYTPLKGKSIFDKSVENTPILAPVVEGGQRSYFSGGAGGAGISITKDGKEILKIIHGRTDIPLPKDGAIPSAPKPAPVTPQNPPSTKPQSISSVVAPPSQTNIASINTSNFISAPTTTQQNYLAQLETSSTQTEDKNDMLIINNQQQPMPTYNKKEPSIILESAGKSPSEVLKNLMLQRLLA
jgi:hypothetical protein